MEKKLIRLKKKNNPNLIKKVITNKAGHKQTVWVKRDTKKTTIKKPINIEKVISGKKIHYQLIGKNKYAITTIDGHKIANVIAPTKSVLNEKLKYQVSRYYKSATSKIFSKNSFAQKPLVPLKNLFAKEIYKEFGIVANVDFHFRDQKTIFDSFIKIRKFYGKKTFDKLASHTYYFTELKDVLKYHDLYQKKYNKFYDLPEVKRGIKKEEQRIKEAFLEEDYIVPGFAHGKKYIMINKNAKQSTMIDGGYKAFITYYRSKDYDGSHGWFSEGIMEKAGVGKIFAHEFVHLAEKQIFKYNNIHKQFAEYLQKVFGKESVIKKYYGYTDEYRYYFNGKLKSFIERDIGEYASYDIMEFAAELVSQAALTPKKVSSIFKPIVKEYKRIIDTQLRENKTYYDVDKEFFYVRR